MSFYKVNFYNDIDWFQKMLEQFRMFTLERLAPVGFIELLLFLLDFCIAIIWLCIMFSKYNKCRRAKATLSRHYNNCNPSESKLAEGTEPGEPPLPAVETQDKCSTFLFSSSRYDEPPYKYSETCTGNDIFLIPKVIILSKLY